MELYHLTWSISRPGIRIGLSKPLNWVLSTHLAASLKNLRNHPFTNHFINMCPTTVRWDYLNIWYPKKSRLHHHIMIKQNTYWLPLFIIKVEASSSSTYIYHKKHCFVATAAVCFPIFTQLNPAMTGPSSISGRVQPRTGQVFGGPVVPNTLW